MKCNSRSRTALLCGLALTPLILLSGSAAYADQLFAAPAGHTQPVNLGTAGKFAILTESGIADVPTSNVTGNVGVSPGSGATDTLSCGEVNGKIYSTDALGPQPCSKVDTEMLSNAVSDMQAAYTDAANRKATKTNLDGGNLGGHTLKPGVYNFSTGVTIDANNLKLKGGKNSVWIFQITGDLDESTGANIKLSKNAQAKNVFWQVAGATSIGSSATFEGVVLDESTITLGSQATVHGNVFAQTSASLDANVIKLP